MMAAWWWGLKIDKVYWVIFFTQGCTGQISYDRLLLSVSECCLGLHSPSREWNSSRRDYWRAGNKPTHHRVAGKGWTSCNKSIFILKAIKVSHTVDLVCHTWTQSHMRHGCAWTICAQQSIKDKSIKNIFKQCHKYFGDGEQEQYKYLQAQVKNSFSTRTSRAINQHTVSTAQSSRYFWTDEMLTVTSEGLTSVNI